MKKTFGICFSLLWAVILAAAPLCSTAFAARDLANDGRIGLNIYYDIDKILRMDDEQIDLATASLILSRQWGTTNPILRYRGEIDDMAKAVLERMYDRSIPADFRALTVINRYLFDELGFETVETADNPDDLFLHTVIEQRRGYCLSLSVLYLSIAERIGLPVYGVVVPGHFFVRYDDGRRRYNIETTSRGATPEDAHYIKKFSPPDFDGSIYMQNLTKVQTLGCFFNNLGNSYSDIGDQDMAQLQLERAVKINPALAEAHTNLGNIYLLKSYPQQAVDQYQLALRVLPEDPKIHNNLGNAYSRLEHYNKAVSHYLSAIRYDKEFVDAYVNLASTYMKQGQHRKGLTQLKLALSIDDQNPDIYRQTGDIYYDLKDYNSAITSYMKSLYFEPRQPHATLNLGYCYLNKELYDNSVDYFSRAIHIDSSLVNAYFGLASAYSKKGLRDFEIRTYEALLQVAPNTAAALQNLANAYQLDKRYEDALVLYEKALSLEPMNTNLYYNTGVALVNLKNYEDASAYYEKAVELDYKHAGAHNGLAICLYMMNEKALAYKHAKIAKQLGYDVQPELLKQP